MTSPGLSLKPRAYPPARGFAVCARIGATFQFGRI